MKTNDIKKGMKIRTDQLGILVSGTMEDNQRGSTRFIYTNADEIGMVSEYGSVYAYNIIEVFDESKNEWVKVEHTPKQLNMKTIVF